MDPVDGDAGTPLYRATNVPVNAVIEVQAERGSEHGERRERGEQCAYAAGEAGSSAVAGTVTAERESADVHAAGVLLAVSTAYTLTASGFTDLAWERGAAAFTSGS